MLQEWLKHPLTRGLDIDDPKTTELRRRIIREKGFLRRFYVEWYESLVQELPAVDGAVLELGSGAGFLDEFVPSLITSEVFYCLGVRVILDACDLPFAEHSLRAIVMTDVLHHIPDVRDFFAEASRCVRPGGAIVMVEPWVTRWSRMVYQHLHHEPFLPGQTEWEFPRSGPLSGANGALPWILFERDREKFAQEFPSLQITKIRVMMPFRYLVSGGVSLRALMPEWSFAAWKKIDEWTPLIDRWGMFAIISLKRIEI